MTLPEGRDEHRHDAEHHEAREAGHAVEQQVHILDVAAADVMLGGADAQEQQRLGDGVEQDQERRGPDRLGRADAGAGRDQAEVGDRRVREDALGVALRDREGGADEEREPADEHEHAARNRADGEHGSQLNEQEHAGLDHRRGMEQRARGRRRHHGAQQPGVERHLRRLGNAREREGGDGEHGDLRDQLPHRQKLGERERPHGEHADEQADQKRDAAEQVHDDLAERVADGLLGARVGDEEERAQRRDLPAGEQPRHVVGEDDDVHGGEEDEHQREEGRTAIERALGLMRLEILHVAERVDADRGADDADDEHHEQRQLVVVQRSGDLDAVSEVQLEDERADQLHDGEDDREGVFVLRAEADHRDGDDDADDRAYAVDYRG